MKKASLERLLHTSRNAGMTVVEGLYLLETELMSFSRVSSATLGQEIKQYQRDKNAADDMRFLGFTLFESDGSNRVLQGKPCPHFPPGPAGKHLDSGKPLLFWRVPAPATERLYMAVPMKRGIRDKAYLVAEINPVYLWSLVMRTLPPETALCVIDPHGHQLFSSSSTPLPRYIPLVIQKLSTLSVGHFEWDGRDDAATVSYWTAFLTPLYQTESWVIVASQQRKRHPRADPSLRAHVPAHYLPRFCDSGLSEPFPDPAQPGPSPDPEKRRSAIKPGRPEGAGCPAEPR